MCKSRELITRLMRARSPKRRRKSLRRYDDRDQGNSLVPSGPIRRVGRKQHVAWRLGGGDEQRAPSRASCHMIPILVLPSELALRASAGAVFEADKFDADDEDAFELEGRARVKSNVLSNLSTVLACRAAMHVLQFLERYLRHA